MPGDELTGEALVQFVIQIGCDPAKLFGSENLLADTALKRAYKRMALRLHPDKNSVPGAHEAFGVMHRSFETALEVLHARRRASPPPSASASPRAETQTSWPPPPAPPTAWPGNNEKRKTPSAGHDAGCQHGERGLEDDLFEIPLPPDVFRDFAMPDDPSGTSKHVQPTSSRSCEKPPPALDLSSSCSSSDRKENDTKAGIGGGTRVNRKTRAKMRSHPHPQQAPGDTAGRESNRVTLKQLFRELNIDDNDDDDDDDGDGVLRGNVKSSGDPAMMVATVSCPYCGMGEFAAHSLSPVVCSSCRGSFVPHAIRMTNAARQAARQKRRNVAPASMCSCGRAKKGLCFLCD